MIVVADSSPLVALTAIGHIDVLPKLFGSVVIPPQISDELSQPNRPQAVRDLITSPPDWLHERAPVPIQPIPALHAGEVAAISLARELKADLCSLMKYAVAKPQGIFTYLSPEQWECLKSPRSEGCSM